MARALWRGFLCTLALGGAVAAQADTLPGVLFNGEPHIIIRGQQSAVNAIAAMMQAQHAGAHLRLDCDPLPDFNQLRRLLPVGTQIRGSHVLLPNGCDFTLVKAQSAAWYKAQEEADDRMHTYTRQELINRFVQLKPYLPRAIVKVKRPHSTAFVKIGTWDQAIFEAPFLPTGARTMAVVPTTKMEIAFYRVGGKPVLPVSHDEPHPGLRWTQQPNGRWEEVMNAGSCPPLHWRERVDGYWEEAARPAAKVRLHTSR